MTEPIWTIKRPQKQKGKRNIIFFNKIDFTLKHLCIAFLYYYGPGIFIDTKTERWEFQSNFLIKFTGDAFKGEPYILFATNFRYEYVRRFGSKRHDNISSTKAELQRTSLYWSTTLVDLFSLIWKYSQRAIHINMHKSPMHVNQMACWNRPFCVGLYVLIKMIKKVVKCLFNRLNRFWMQFMCFENLRTQTFLAPAYASSNAECSICFANRLLDTALDLLCI